MVVRTHLRNIWHRLRPPRCPLCWVRPAHLGIHLRTEHTSVEVNQYLAQMQGWKS